MEFLFKLFQIVILQVKEMEIGYENSSGCQTVVDFATRIQVKRSKELKTANVKMSINPFDEIV